MEFSIRNPKTSSVSQGRLFFSVFKNIFNFTVKKSTKIIDRNCRNRFIVFQSVNQTSADAEIVDQFIGAISPMLTLNIDSNGNLPFNPKRYGA